jgi:4-amino-4-deoxychorismate lyase
VTERPVVAVLGRGVVPADTPILRADDLGVLRGDGIFETIHVAGGAPRLLEQHLDRMARSAARLELDLPDREALTGLAAATCAGWPASTEGALRLVCTRGAEAGGPATVFARLTVGPEQLRAARRTGLAVATADLGVTATARAEAPWLLGGVKALSYAVNMASQRWAGSRALDDVLWVSADGYALEAPTSSLVWLAGGVLCTVPPERTGILPGITAGWLLGRAPALGWQAERRMIRPAELPDADGVWLTSSVRGVAAVRELDGVALPATADTTKLQQLLDQAG